MSARPHVVVLHRWRDAYAHYDRYLDHDEYAVSYVTTDVGAAGVPPVAVAVALVDATDDVEQVDARIRELAARLGRPAAVVALKEDDLLAAAVLGQRWGCPGRTPQELTPFRDKLIMARRVAAAGLPVPATAPAPDPAAVRAHAARHGWPVVLKPRLGSSSAGVRLVADPDGAARVGHDPGRLVQAYHPDPIHHVDGVFDGHALGPWRVSAYLDTCLAFRDGRPLGSVEQDDPVVRDTVGAFTLRVLRALTDRPTVFHLELFLGRADDGSPRCTFLEVGARFGGAEIPFVWRDVHGYDLAAAAFALALGHPPPPPPPPRPEVAGWLLLPAPARRPCRITEATSMIGRDPGPYAEVVPRVGDVLPAADAYYEHVGARYRFRGSGSAAVHAAVVATARDARVSAATDLAGVR
ncbi:ATP-grasp domain-containing protein [Micromonospora nigra]|uniref:ATP-grasp domain-containing protein n=1 Tax=Micromonospora nigra TaxID=145857 RepID=A0A1C6R9B2_9ACTN|nr:biotin carboxylase [Micromonospora nigra]SCL13547.1 ATP-grasp domain-containing protein [Micromonospora nigra]